MKALVLSLTVLATLGLASAAEANCSRMHSEQTAETPPPPPPPTPST